MPRALAGERVDRVVALLAGLGRGEAGRLVDAGDVTVAGRPVRARSRRVAEGDVLEIRLAAPDDAPLRPDPAVELVVVHADEHVVVVDKPAGLVVHPGAGHSSGTLVQGLLARFPEIAGVGDPARPGVVHRLDAGTSGLLMVARSAHAHRSLVSQLAARTVERRYLALVWGRMPAPAGLVDAPVGRSERDRTRMAVVAGGRAARTTYRVLAEFSEPAPVSLLECRLETGRTHQVRVHLAAVGHSVVGDRRYQGARDVLALARPFLHAAVLAFDHPAAGARMRFRSPLPPELEEIRGRLR